MRQVILDTETTGLEPESGHKIIEIGCVEIINRRLTGNHYHQYLQPDREIDKGAMDVHGITNEFLKDKPRFVDVVNDFLSFVENTELIIHNAPFDVGFIDWELGLVKHNCKSIEQICTVTDTLKMARNLHPGQRNNLDALCKRYEIDNSQRTLHGALLDAEILADVYLAMTGGQASLNLIKESTASAVTQIDAELNRKKSEYALKVVKASPAELEAHDEMLRVIRDKCSGKIVWDELV